MKRYISMDENQKQEFLEHFSFRDLAKKKAVSNAASTTSTIASSKTSGRSRAQHKYIAKVGNRYYYPGDKLPGQSAQKTSTSKLNSVNRSFTAPKTATAKKTSNPINNRLNSVKKTLDSVGATKADKLRVKSNAAYDKFVKVANTDDDTRKTERAYKNFSTASKKTAKAMTDHRNTVSGNLKNNKVSQSPKTTSNSTPKKPAAKVASTPKPKDTVSTTRNKTKLDELKSISGYNDKKALDATHKTQKALVSNLKTTTNGTAKNEMKKALKNENAKAKSYAQKYASSPMGKAEAAYKVAKTKIDDLIKKASAKFKKAVSDARARNAVKNANKKKGPQMIDTSQSAKPKAVAKSTTASKPKSTNGSRPHGQTTSSGGVKKREATQTKTSSSVNTKKKEALNTLKTNATNSANKTKSKALSTPTKKPATTSNTSLSEAAKKKAMGNLVSSTKTKAKKSNPLTNAKKQTPQSKPAQDERTFMNLKELHDEGLPGLYKRAEKRKAKKK